MKTVIKENTWLARVGFENFGWGNGYVIIPPNHKLHGRHYDDIDVNVHGNLTFSELADNKLIEWLGLDIGDLGSWVVGFDTAHFGDTLEKWSKEAVQAETENLLNQLLSYKGE
jgi:hypothetical protein